MGQQLPSETVYPTLGDVLCIYAGVIGIDTQQVSEHVRDWSLLESALVRPQQVAFYERADLVGQAVVLLCGLIQNHPFRDGNKRAAYAVTLSFLRANGWTITATEDEEFCLLIDIAQHATVVHVVSWMREHIAVFDP